MTDLSIEVCGIRHPNPFLLASGPPGTNGKVIQRSFALGWGGIVCKTISLDNAKVHNTAPRYAKLEGRGSGEVLGYQNIELISDHHLELNLSCPHGMPERRMGEAMGQDPEIVEEVVRWAKEASRVPRLREGDAERHRARHLRAGGGARGGADEISAIHTIFGSPKADVA